MSTLQDAIKIARSALNDDIGLSWTDALIIPKITQAWGELLVKFQLNGIDVVKKETSSPIVVTTGTLSVPLPADMQIPIEMKEYAVGETVDQAVPMTKTDFTPTLQQERTLRYWSWSEQQIKLLGATTDRNVLLYYIKTLSAPKRLTDTLTIDQAEIYLGPRAASLCLGSKGANSTAEATAQANLSMLVRARVKPMQSLPVRRRPFSYRARRGRQFS